MSVVSGEYSVVGSGADCKSVTFGSGGSIPSSPTIWRLICYLKQIKKKEEVDLR